VDLPTWANSVRLTGSLLNLIGQRIKAPGRFRIEYLGRQAAALDGLLLCPDQQFDVFAHGPHPESCGFRRHMFAGVDPGYCLLAVQRPLQPSARLYEPLPVLPDILPIDVSATPSSPMLAER
jgi:hypothetical protein